MQSELPISPSARSDKNARELIRAWEAHSRLHCSVNVGSWGDNERVAWAIVLTDVVRHVANALNEESGDKGETIREIRSVFNDEVDSPTAEATGGFLKQ